MSLAALMGKKTNKAKHKTQKKLYFLLCQHEEKENVMCDIKIV